MSEPVLAARNISRRFGGLLAVDSVSLDLMPAQIHALIGPNGAGKSTFLATLSGDLAPTGGQVLLRGQDVTALSLQARAGRGIGRTYQRSAIIPGFSALDMVRIAALRGERRMAWLRALSASRAVTARARAALERVGLSDRADVAADILSHGEKRRLEIAAVLATNPSILLLDEPLAGLGPDEARDIVALVRRLRETCAVLLVEHDIDVVFAAADRITVLDNGKMIGSGTPSEVRASAAVQNAYLGSEEDV